MIQQIKKLILEDAAFYDGQMNEIKLNLFADALKDIPVQDIQRAMAYFREEKGRTRMPMPADIKAFLKPNVSDDGRAREIASRIREAVSKYGWNNSADAQAYVGAIGWGVVARFGGWQYICENLGLELSPDAFYAQCRDLAKAHIEFGNAGVLGDRALLEHKPQPGLTNAGDVVQKLLASKGQS